MPRISQLPELITVTPADLVPLVQSGATGYTTVLTFSMEVANILGASTFDPAGTAAGLMAAHVAAVDPHAQYLLETTAALTYEPIGTASGLLGAHVAAPDPHTQYLLETTAALTYLPVTGGTLNDVRFVINPVNPPTTEGSLAWNPVDKTLDLHSDVANATLQIGQENWVRVVNKSGVTITDGTAVYVNSAQGNRPTILPIDASATSTVASKIIGVVTADILNNAEGYVTTLGLLRGYNTSGFVDGDELWASATTPGLLTKVKPDAPAYQIRVAVALNSTNNGMILVAPHFLGELPRVLNATKEPTGFESPDLVSISYDSANRTVTLTQTGGVALWWKGTRFVLTSPWTSAAHATDNGDWFLSAKSAAAPTWTQSAWVFSDEAPVCYTRRVGGVNAFAMREVHGLMPWQTHQELHDLLGTYRKSGGSLTAGTFAIQPAGPVDADNTPGVDSVTIADEDCPTTLPAWTQGTYTNLYIAASSVATFATGASLPFRVTGTYPNINDPTTGAETETATGRYFNVYAIFMPVTGDAGSQTYRVVWLQPQTAYTTLAAAQAEDFRSRSLGNLSALSPEFIAYAMVTYRTSSSYNSATGRCRIEAVAYLSGGKASQITISGLNPASHTVLSDRSDPDQHPQSAITNLTTDLAAKAPLASPTFTGKVTTAASAAVAGAGFNLPHGTAPNTPADGDVWSTSAGVYARVNGVTVGPFGAGTGGGMSWSVVTGATNAVAGNGYVVDASSAPVTVTLPGSPTVGDQVGVSASSVANAVTIARNGKPLIGGTADMTLAHAGDGVVLIFTGDTFGWTTGTELAVDALPPSQWWGRITDSTTIAITGAVSATIERMHYVSGTSADYDITLPAASSNSGKVIAFSVAEVAAASKQYRLDAGAGVKIAGRTRYLALVHTNSVLLISDGTNWRALEMKLDTPEVDAGAMAVTSTGSSPTKNATRDVFFWRRIGDSMHYRWEYVQASGGGDGTGTYLLAIPFTASANVNVSGSGTNAKARSSVGFGQANNQCLIGSLFDTTHIYGTLVQSAMNLFSQTNLAWSGERYFTLTGSIPIADW